MIDFPTIADVPVRLRGLEKRKADVMDTFTKCTKDDVSLNNFLARAKSLHFNIRNFNQLTNSLPLHVVNTDPLWATVPRNMKPAATPSVKTPNTRPKKDKSKSKAKKAKPTKPGVEDSAPGKAKKRKGE